MATPTAASHAIPPGHQPTRTPLPSALRQRRTWPPIQPRTHQRHRPSRPGRHPNRLPTGTSSSASRPPSSDAAEAATRRMQQGRQPRRRRRPPDGNGLPRQITSTTPTAPRPQQRQLRHKHQRQHRRCVWSSQPQPRRHQHRRQHRRQRQHRPRHDCGGLTFGVPHRRHRRRRGHAAHGLSPPLHAQAATAAPVPRQELLPKPAPHLRGHEAHLLSEQNSPQHANCMNVHNATDTATTYNSSRTWPC